MKFGKYMRDTMVPEWREHYVNYKTLKAIVKKVATRSLGAEQTFISTLEAEMKKAHQFYVSTIASLVARLRADHSRATCDAISSEIIRISQFAYVNEEAVRKSLKKHDRSSFRKMGPTFLLQLPAFCPPQHVDSAMCLLSDYFLEAEKGKHNVGGPKKYSEQTFVRKSVKCWVRLKDVTAVVCAILPHLPIYHFKARPGDPSRSMAAPITSIYFDTPDFYCFRTRMQKEEGATLIRVRWYGNSDPTREVYVERKLHHESWVQEKSAKSRFPLSADRVMSFFHDPKGKGKVASPAPEADDRATAARSSKPPKPLTAEELQLMEEVREFVTEHPIRPMVATKYLRAAFQLPDDNSVRVSLDTDLSMIRERVAWGQEWYVPDDRLLDSDVHRFPYAVLEIKLQGGEGSRPPWVSALLDSELLIPVEKFSKFGHGCAVLYNNQVPLLPYWFQGREAEFVREADDTTESIAGAVGEVMERRASRKRESSNLSAATQREQEEDQAGAEDSGILGAVSGFCCGLLPDEGSRQLEKGKVKIEPKTYFANERTYLQWFNAGSILGSLSVAMLHLPGKSYIGGLLFLPVAVAIMLYALSMYQLRLRLLRRRRMEGYHDAWGPTLLTLLLAIGIVISTVFSLVSRLSRPAASV